MRLEARPDSRGILCPSFQFSATFQTTPRLRQFPILAAGLSAVDTGGSRIFPIYPPQLKKGRAHCGLCSNGDTTFHGYIVGPTSFVSSHTPVLVCDFNTWTQGVPPGPLSSAGVLKSKNSLMSREGSCQ